MSQRSFCDVRDRDLLKLDIRETSVRSLKRTCEPYSIFAMLLRHFTTLVRKPSGSLRSVSSVSIVEVGPRDGLQNEPAAIPTSTKLGLITNLVDSGLKRVEATAFVSPKWVPQMGDSSDVMEGIKGLDEGVKVSVLTPNLKGLESAAKSGRVDAVAVFGAASQSFSQKNINCTIEESIGRFSSVASEALRLGVKVRGYISCVAGCPYEGPIDPRAVASVWSKLKEMGCYEVSGSEPRMDEPKRSEERVQKLCHERTSYTVNITFDAARYTCCRSRWGTP